MLVVRAYHSSVNIHMVNPPTWLLMIRDLNIRKGRLVCFCCTSHIGNTMKISKLIVAAGRIDTNTGREQFNWFKHSTKCWLDRILINSALRLTLLFQQHFWECKLCSSSLNTKNQTLDQLSQSHFNIEIQKLLVEYPYSMEIFW